MSVHPAVLPAQVLVESAEVQSGLAAGVSMCVLGGGGGGVEALHKVNIHPACL